MSRTSTIVRVCGLVAALLAGTACIDPADEANKALEGSGVELDNLGKSVPSSFPASEVALPDLELESAIGATGTYVFRYTSPQPVADIAAYEAALTASGFTILDEFGSLSRAEPASTAEGNVGFRAEGPRWTVTAVAFGEGAADGLYMGITVEPRAG